MNTIVQRGFDLIGDAYQKSFDEFRAKINEKIELTTFDNIRLADFTFENQLDQERVLKNLSSKECAVGFCNTIKTINKIDNCTFLVKDDKKLILNVINSFHNTAFIDRVTRYAIKHDCTLIEATNKIKEDLKSSLIKQLSFDEEEYAKKLATEFEERRVI